MPSTYTLISSNVLSSSAASVTFSAIPNTFTDLLIKVSTRTDFFTDITVVLNSDTASNYSKRDIEGDGSAAYSFASSNVNAFPWTYANNNYAQTTNTFSNGELYIPSYTASQNKPLGGFAVTENNGTTSVMAAVAGLWRNTAAITSIQLQGNSFVSGSSFFLYGIKNS
jgi:hypothetical protein